MKTFQKFLPKYSIALALLFLVTLYLLMTRSNTVELEAVRVTPADLVQAVYATGFAEPDAVATLNAETSGYVVAVGAREGEQVSKGQIIVQLDGERQHFAVREARAAVAEQQAVLNDNKLRLQRKKNLFREGAISRQELEEAEKNSTQSQELLQQRMVQLTMREDDVNKLRLIAPFSGILTLQSVKKGDYVTQNSVVARVVDPSRFMVSVEVDELDIPHLRVGQQATVAFDAYPDKRFTATVNRVVQQTDRVTKTSKVYLTLERLPEHIQAGMTATANIIYNIRPHALLVRKRSIVEENRQSYVWKVQQGKLKKQRIQQGASDITYVEVQRGLAIGDVIALEPNKDWHEGMEVKFVKKKL